MGVWKINQQFTENTPIYKVPILLVCSPGLSQISLLTAIHAIPFANIIAKANDAGSAVQLAQQLNPVVLLVDAISLSNETIPLLRLIKEQLPGMICIVLITAYVQKSRYLQNGADFVLEDQSLSRELNQILSIIHTYKRSDE